MISITEQLAKHVSHIADYLPEDEYDDWQRVAEWIDDGDFDNLEDLEQQPLVDLAFSYGYLRGAADAHGMTVLNLLDAQGVDIAKAVKEGRD